MVENLYKWIGLSVDDAIESIVKNTKVTFADNMDEPIHRWFKFSAGFSAELVRAVMRIVGVRRGNLVLDPFTGCGTTNVVAKSLGVDSIGVELHSFLAWVAHVKTFWEYDMNYLKSEIHRVISEVKENIGRVDVDIEGKPELLYKCYSKETLKKLYIIKDIVDSISDKRIRDFMTLALVSILRKVTHADVGWPYVLPKKRKRKNIPNVAKAFEDQLLLMYNDLKTMLKNCKVVGNAKIYEADARSMNIIEDESIDFAFTSPPYLNNYDYADRTRLELYFLGWASSWREITEKIRKKLIVSCSHQAKEKGLKEGLTPDDDIPHKVREELIQAADRLRKIKYTRGGKKDYDIMIVAYFNDMLKTMYEMYRVLKKGAYYCMVVGDSAPYGVHIPTDEYLAEIGKKVGFSKSNIYVLRERGHKWSYVVKAGRRHGVKLRESIILFQK